MKQYAKITNSNNVDILDIANASHWLLNEQETNLEQIYVIAKTVIDGIKNPMRYCCINPAIYFLTTIILNR